MSDTSREHRNESGRDEPDLEQLIGQYVERLDRGEELDPFRILAENPARGQDILSALEDFVRLGREESPPPLGVLGDYTLRRQIGRGGMGVVYEAWQGSVDRVVALKVLPPGVAVDERAFTRFMREAKTAGKLDHQNIVSVHAAGFEENTPYFAMELVKGETLTQILTRTREEGPEAETPFGRKDDVAYFGNIARAFAEVADGLQHAHSRGVTHRDIKPSNLILDTEAEHGQLGRLRILDFGLARLEGQESLTISGDFLGTPLYMSPEQARRRKISVDHRTDVYSLGATMYEALCGRPPFRGKDHADTLSRIIERDPVEPGRINPRVPQDLETIVLKCLRKDASDRYRTAEALGQDLRRFVRGDPVEARPQLAWERIARRVWRRRWSVATAGVVSVLLATVFALALNQVLVSREEAERNRNEEYDRELRVWKPRLLRCQIILDAAAGRYEALDPEGYSSVFNFEGLATDTLLADTREAFETLAESAPQRFEAHFYLATALLLDGRPGEARKRLERVRELAPTFPPAIALAAEIEGKPLDEDSVRGSLAGHPDALWQALWLEAILARSSGHAADAARAYDRLVALDRDGEILPGFSIDLRLARGLTLLEAGEYRRAAESFAAARDLWPKSLEAGLLLGKAYLLDGQREWAKQLLREIHANATSPDEVATWIAVTHLSLEENFEALEWGLAIEDPMDRKRVRSWCLLDLMGYSLGGAPDRKERRERALAAARLALGDDSGDTSSLLLAACCLYWSRETGGTERLEEAERLCGEVIAAEGTSLPASALLALITHGRRASEPAAIGQAVELARAVVRESADDFLASVLAIPVLWWEGRTDELREAIARQERDLARLPARERAYWVGVKALVQSSDGQHEQAIDTFESALRLDPRIRWARSLRCALLYQLGRVEHAADCLRQSVASMAVGTPWLVLALEELGDTGGAVAALCEVLAREPARAELQDDLVGIIRRHGTEVLPGDLSPLLGSLEKASRDPTASPALLRTLAFLRLHAPGARDVGGAREAIDHALSANEDPDPETLAVLAEVLYAERYLSGAICTLETALGLPRARGAHRRLLESWRAEAFPHLFSLESIDAALESHETPGGDEDLALLEAFGNMARDARDATRRAYLEARVLQRRGETAAAAEILGQLAGEGVEAEAHLRLTECLLALGRKEEAASRLRRVLAGEAQAPRDLWHLWLDVVLNELEQEPAEALERFPGTRRAHGFRHLLRQLASSGAVRINCGAKDDLTTADGRSWQRDRFSLAGHTRPILGGPTELHRTRRWFWLDEDEDRPGYAIPLSNGEYTVTLHFCEKWARAPGVRVFDVSIEGETRLASYDGFARAGFGVATSESLDVPVEDGLLEIEFRPRRNGASVAAIEVVPAPGRAVEAVTGGDP